MSWDPYLDLEHGVLRNRLGITDPKTLAASEAAAVALRLAEIEVRPIPGQFDLSHLQHLHFWLFQDVYPFAGQLRTVLLGKGGQPFCPPEELIAGAAQILDRRADPVHLRGLARADVVDALTNLLAGVNVLHPFREGNGRAQRSYLRQLARESGWRLTWTGLSQDRNTAAARAANAGDVGPLRELLDERLTSIRPPPRRRVTCSGCE